MSQPQSSGGNKPLHTWNEDKEKDQASSSWVGAPDMMTSAEREIARERVTNVRPGGAERVDNEQVIGAEGLGGPFDTADETDVVGDRAEAPDPVDGSGVSRTFVSEGMGGAGGGDLDDLGDQALPPDNPGAREIEELRRPVLAQPSEGMGGADGGDLDDLGSVAYPREER